MAVKTKKESQYFGWANAWRAELRVTCSHCLHRHPQSMSFVRQ